MRRVVLGTVLSIFALSLMGQNQALGSLCGVSRCCHSTCCKPCCQNCCIVMQTCQETVYEYQEMTAYKIVYEDVATPVKVPCVAGGAVGAKFPGAKVSADSVTVSA